MKSAYLAHHETRAAERPDRVWDEHTDGSRRHPPTGRRRAGDREWTNP